MVERTVADDHCRVRQFGPLQTLILLRPLRRRAAHALTFTAVELAV